MASMFNNARNVVISGGAFVINNIAAGPNLDALDRRVAPNAILNAGGRRDEARSYSRATEIVFERVETWRDAPDGHTAPLFWLSGPAGSGKTAAMQTIVEDHEARGAPQASFFFYRQDQSRNNASLLFPTLLHQIVMIYPSLRNSVATALSTDPSVLDSVLDKQLEQLIIKPLRAIQQSSYGPYRQLLVLIDGLDECDSTNPSSQQEILRAFGEVLAAPRCPFRLLVSSRAEPPIIASFHRLPIRVISIHLDPLLEQFQPSNAIINVRRQMDPVRVYPRTRERVIGRIENWKDSQDSSAAPMLWLSGPAGVGKSAIMRTFAERCIEQGVPQANFFSSKADSRNTSSNLIATLLYQVRLLHPMVREIVDKVFHTTPSIQKSTFDNQFAQLIVAPLCAIQQSSQFYQPLIVLIDGIDEFVSETQSSQQEILRTFDKYLVEHSCPFRLLLSSRSNGVITYQISTRLISVFFDSFSDELDDRHAPNANLNAGRTDQVGRCHPHTRTLVIHQIEKWRDTQDTLTASILWLSGPVGAGKSAIMQTLAERCIEQGISQSNFFFFRADNSRNTVSPLIATLLHQIKLLYPSLWEVVAEVLMANPSIWDSILEEQLAQLIVAPLRTIQQSSTNSYQPVLTILIDGLDECDSETKHGQQQILSAFDKALAEPYCPFRLVVASRNESQIKGIFEQLSAPVHRIYLDDEYSPDSDIRLYVTEKFAEIQKSHYPDENWPSASAIDDIVEKSSGQFIYAATAMRFISESSEDPKLSLKQVQGIAQSTPGSDPFSQLDAAYTYVLARAVNQQVLKDVLHVAFVLQSFDRTLNVMLQRILETYNWTYTDKVIHSCISDINALARFERRELTFYHASLVDYLQTKSRSGEFYIDLHTFGPKIFRAIWEHIGKKQGVQFGHRFASTELTSVLPDFMNTIIELEAADFETFGNVQEMKNVFDIVYGLCTDDEIVATYKQMIRRWTTQQTPLILSHQEKELSGINDIPCIKRYIMMAKIDHRDDVLELTPERADALRPSPSSPFDIHETAMWIGDLLQRVYRKYYSHHPQRYRQISREWISWAVSNNIPFDHFDGIPYAQWFFWTCMIQEWADSSSNLIMSL